MHTVFDLHSSTPHPVYLLSSDCEAPAWSIAYHTHTRTHTYASVVENSKRGGHALRYTNMHTRFLREFPPSAPLPCRQPSPTSQSAPSPAAPHIPSLIPSVSIGDDQKQKNNWLRSGRLPPSDGLFNCSKNVDINGLSF